MDSVDPLMSDTAYARLKQMGELAYNRELAGRAQAWISAHPTQRPGIAHGYLRQYYFPPEWLWHTYSDRSRGTWVKAPIGREYGRERMCQYVYIWEDARI